MKINIKILFFSVLIIVFVGIGVSNITGLWKTESEKIPKKINSGESKDLYNPMDIKGSYTFSDVSKYFQIPIEDIAKAFGVEISKAKDFKCKDLKTLYGNSNLEIDSIRYFVAFYKGIKINLEDNVYLPNLAKDIIIKNGIPQKEQVNYISKHLIMIKK